jgi:hypothetical protein
VNNTATNIATAGSGIVFSVDVASATTVAIDAYINLYVCPEANKYL